MPDQTLRAFSDLVFPCLRAPLLSAVIRVVAVVSLSPVIARRTWMISASGTATRGLGRGKRSARFRQTARHGGASEKRRFGAILCVSSAGKPSASRPRPWSTTSMATRPTTIPETCRVCVRRATPRRQLAAMVDSATIRVRRTQQGPLRVRGDAPYRGEMPATASKKWFNRLF